MRCREHQRDQARLVRREHGRALRADRVEHRERVVRPLFERSWHGGRARIRQTHPAPVEANHAGERRKPAQASGEMRFLGHHVDRNETLGHDHEIDRAVAFDLVCDVRITASRVPR